MLRIGLTGGIGSGKTTVGKLFEELGIPVYYADQRAKHLMNYDPDLKKQIKSLLGSESYYDNGRLNRTYVAYKVFNDRSLLQKINHLVHPAVHKDAERWYQTLGNVPFTIYEAALIFESNGHNRFDRIIVVSAPEEVRIQRVMDRDDVVREKVVERINNQIPQEEKDKKADFLIINVDLHSLKEQVRDIYSKIVNLTHVSHL
ncbi:MAG TPA: dephospho-CoA kinase [Saprospiraceae bacterium]|nr:dephospho-CoA kinase [Saprospiraceae bacterium]